MKNSKLAHLNPEELSILMEWYYEKSLAVEELIELFELKDITPSRLYSYFPPLVSDHSICKFCNCYLVQDRESRSSDSWRRNDFYCPECGHVENNPCSCENCE